MDQCRLRRRGLWLAVVTLLASCVDGKNPTDVGMVRAVRLAAEPVFAGAPSAAEAAALNHIRVTARDTSTGDVLALVDQDVDPTAQEWAVSLTLEVTVGNPVGVQLEVELGSAGETAWSGRTAPITVTAGTAPQETHRITLYRGPLANLDVTGVTAEADSALLEGQATRVTVTLEGGAAGARAYFESLDTAVATVDAGGNVRTLSPGTARIVALAGPAADTVAIAVREVKLPPPDSIAALVTPQVGYAVAIAGGGMGDATAGAAIAQALGQLESALADGKGRDAVSAFQTAVAAWTEYGAETELRMLDAPQLGVVELALIQAADALGIPFD